MHKGKVIDSVVIIATVVDIVMDTKIAKSKDLGAWASCKHNGSVEFDEKLALVCLESSDLAYKRHK